MSELEDSAGLALDMLDRKLKGSSWSTIAEQFGMDPRHVAEFVADALLAEPKVAAEIEVRLDLARLDKLLVSVWRTAVKGDPKSVDQSMKILELRTKRLGQLAELEAPAPSPSAEPADQDAPAALGEPESPAVALARVRDRERAAVAASRGGAALHLIRDDEGDDDE